MEIIAVGVIVIDFKFPLSVSYSAYVLSRLVVNLFMDVMVSAAIGVFLIGVLIGMCANALAVVIIALEFPVPTLLKEFFR